MSLNTSIRQQKSFRLPRLATEDTILLKAVGAALLIWAMITAIFVWVIPDQPGRLVEDGAAFSDFVGRHAAFFLVGFLILSFARMLSESNGTSLVTHMRTVLAADPARFLGAPIMIALSFASFAIFMLVYSTIKIRIPEILPFAWDQTFMEWDKAVFFGQDPWRLFAWVYDYPIIVKAIDSIYDIWALMLVGSWVFCFISRQQSLQRRIQYCLALILTWFIGGNLLAILFSSAGPCYYHLIPGGSDYYAEQMAYLNDIGGLYAISHQNMLWQAYSGPGLGFGGISAMPSMHCATTFLIVLMFGSDRVSKSVIVALFITIFLSSFILAWHYALDGVLAVIVAYACWRVAGRIVRAIVPEETET
ncbi:MAG: phosphatase PAP2 family protein [Pseudomonadota bacterium]